MKFKKKHPRLRKLFLVLLILIVLAALCAAGLWFYMSYHAGYYDIAFYQLTSDKLNENLRVVFISDLHMREYGEDNKTLVADVRALAPGLIVLGGDMVIYPNKDYENMLSLCRQLSEIAPTYAVTGNHENELTYYADDKQLISRFEETGVIFIENKDVTLTVGSNTVQLVGLNGGNDGYSKYGASKEVESLTDSGTVYRIVIDHVPTVFSRKLNSLDYDLGLAGHVHGGIIQLPKLGGIYSSEEGLLPEYYHGLYNMKNGASLIVGAGLGDSFAVPLRINNDPELVVVDINWY